ncbi:MAG: hypothetical protein R2771_16605 [Saprospiraceae bacterium]
MNKNTMMILFTILMLVGVFSACKSTQKKEANYNLESSYYQIKKSYIDSTLEKNTALVHGKIVVILKNQDTIYDCHGYIYINKKDYYTQDEDEFNIVLPVENTVLFFHSGCLLGTFYLTDTLYLKNKENIEMDVFVYERTTQDPSEIQMRERY